MNTFLLCSIIFIFASFLLFLISLFIFTLNENHKKKEMRFKKQYNFLDLVDFRAKIESIDSLSDFDSSFEPLINMSYEFQEEYKQKLLVIKENILYLNDLNYNFKIFQSSKLIKMIAKNINQIHISLDKHDEKIKLSKSLYENISNEIIEYVDIYNNLISFYEKHIMRKYDNNFIVIKIENLRDSFNDLNESKKHFQISYFFNIINNINSILRTMMNLITSLYKNDKICSYIKSNINEIENSLINGSKNIRNKDSVYVEKNLSIMKNKHKNILSELKYVSFNDIERDVNQCFLAIQSIKTKIAYTIKTDIFYNEHIEKVKTWLLKIKEEEVNIFNYLNDVDKIFKDNKKILVQNKNIVILTEKLIKRYKIIKNGDNINSLNAEDYINFIIKTISLLYTWVILLDSAIKNIEDRYSNFSYSIKELSNFKFSIAKIIGAIHEYNILDQSIIDKNINILDKIEDMEKHIHNDYKFIFNNDNVDWLIDRKIDSIESEIYVEKEIRLKFYAEKLLIYSNKFIIKDPSFINKIEIAEKFYIEKHYKKTIDFLLKEIKKFK